MNAAITTLSGFVRDPKDVLLFLIFATTAFLFVRWVTDRFNSGWGKRLLTEFEVLNKLENAEFEKTEKGKRAVVKLRDHISEVVIRKATFRDRFQSVAEAFQFSLIGLVVVLLYSIFLVYDGAVEDAQGLKALVLVVIVMLLLCLLVDLIRILIKVKLVPWLLGAGLVIRALFRLRQIKMVQRGVLGAWDSTRKNTDALIELGIEIGDTPFPEYDMLVNEQLGWLEFHRNQILDAALRVIGNYEEVIISIASYRKGQLVKKLISKMDKDARVLRAAYIANYAEVENAEEVLKKILRKRPNVYFALPER